MQEAGGGGCWPGSLCLLDLDAVVPAPQVAAQQIGVDQKSPRAAPPALPLLFLFYSFLTRTVLESGQNSAATATVSSQNISSLREAPCPHVGAPPIPGLAAWPQPDLPWPAPLPSLPLRSAAVKAASERDSGAAWAEPLWSAC